MEANLKETEDSKRVSDFKLISDELKQQFDLQMRVDDSHNPNLCRSSSGYVNPVRWALSITSQNIEIGRFFPKPVS